jgi:hypothetical protein
MPPNAPPTPHTRKLARTPKVAKALVAGTVAALSLAACGSSHSGWAALAMDGAGRLQAVIAVCDGRVLSSLTLTDETTGTSTTVHPKDPPAFGATIILTGPIANPQPEGVLDLLNRADQYSLTGNTRKADSDKDSGSLAPLHFKLDTVAKEPKLRQDSVFAVNADENGTGLMTKANFVAQAKKECS